MIACGPSGILANPKIIFIEEIDGFYYIKAENEEYSIFLYEKLNKLSARSFMGLIANKLERQVVRNEN